MSPVVVRNAICAFAILVAVAVQAEEKKPAKPAANASKNAFQNIFGLPKEIELSAEQKAKIDELKKEFEAPLKELTAKRDSILTDEQKKARKAAVDAAKAAGKKGKEAQSEIAAAIKLTDDQKKAQQAVEKELKELTGKIREKVTSLLTEDQKAKLPKPKKTKEKASA